MLLSEEDFDPKVILTTVNNLIEDQIMRPQFDNIIVFDIDGVICWQKGVESFDAVFLSKQHSECPIIVWPTTEGDYIHCFIPYLDLLFEYLIAHNNRIVFFSAASSIRNEFIISRLLLLLFGQARSKELLEQGQFEIFSFENMRDASYAHGELYGGRIKDLTVVLKEDESLANTILIEDQFVYAAYDQLPCIMGIRLENLMINTSYNKFSKNATYYLLGLFKEYFTYNFTNEHKTIREWFSDFLLEHQGNNIANKFDVYNIYMEDAYYIPSKADRWVIQIIINGFNEVNAKYQHAQLYQINLQNELIDSTNQNSVSSKCSLTC